MAKNTFFQKLKYLLSADMLSQILPFLSKDNTIHTGVIADGILKLCLFIVLLILLQKFKKFRRVESLETKQTSELIRACHFYFHLPYLDGMYTLYKLKTVGVKIFETWVQKYGSIFEIPVGTQVVTMVLDPSMIQKILMSSDPHYLNKPHYLYDKVLDGSLKDGLLSSEYDTWSNHRKILSRVFDYGSQKRFLPHVNSYAQNFVDDVNHIESANQNKPIWDLLDKQFRNLVAHFVTGSNATENNAGSKFYDDFHSLKRISIQRLLNPHCQVYPFRLFSEIARKYDKLRMAFDNNTGSIVQIRMAKLKNDNKANEPEEGMTSGKKSTFTCLIEEMVHQKVAKKEIQNEVATFLMAGYEVMLPAIQMLLVHLGLNYSEQIDCRKEVNSLCQEKCFSKNNPDDGFNMEDLSKLKHLERCILESLRITATIPLLFRRLDSPLNLKEGLTLATGTTVGISPWALHRDPKLFPNPTKFDSNRFLTENVKKRHPFAYIPFSGGPRNCIGFKMALLEMKVFLAHILRNFEIECGDELDDVNLNFEVTLRPERNFNIILKKRSNE